MKANATLPIRIITHNIRYATDSPSKGEKLWADRKDLIINELRYSTLHNPESFICLQEVLHSQLTDILQGLNEKANRTTGKDEWSYIGVGRDDGKSAGEYCPILFRPSVWHVPEWNTVWLSPTPETPGRGWDAGSIRIVTVGVFRHVASGKRVVGLCTHFDNAGEVSRRKSAKMIEGVVGKVTGAGGTGDTVPVWVAGDLNSEMQGEAYRILNGADSLVQDTRGLAQWRYGDVHTFTGFGEDEPCIIDFVFVGKRGWQVEGFSVLPDLFDGGVYCSDHRAVVVDAVLEV